MLCFVGKGFDSLRYEHRNCPTLIFYTNPAAGTRQNHNLLIMKKTLHVFAIACISLLALPAVAQVPAYVPTDGLVGWWPFNGNANDESGNGNDGVVNGAQIVTDHMGVPNSAFQFGNGSSISVAMSSLLFELPQRSFVCWFNADGGQSGGRIYETTFMNAGVAIVGNSLDTWYGYSQHCCNIVGVDSGELNQWHHLVSTANDETGFTQLFLDGVLISTSNGYPAGGGCLSNTSWQWEGQAIQFGLGASGESFNGLIDDIAIYNRALTEQEIQNLYTGTTPAPCTSLPSNLQQGLVGYWPFCGNANDESGNGNDGTVNGATLTEDRFGNAGKAYSFDGVDDIINVPTLENFDVSFLDGLTMSIWLNSSDLGFNQRLMHFYNNDLDLSIHYATAFQKLYFMNYNFNTGTDNYSHSNQIPSNQWLHATWTIDFNNGISRAYINGEEVGFQDSIPILVGSSMSFRIGNGPTLDNWPFLGSLDDAVIYNRALTPEEVQELYTLDACTFTVYDTTYVTVYDTLTTYETVYDTLYTYETIYDTVTTYVTVTDTLLIDITFTGFEGQPSWLNTVTVFPNPASDHITIDYGNFALMAGYNTVITDAAGATVYSSAVNSQQVEIDINAWGATGVYYMSVYDANGELVAVRHIVLE